MVVGSHKNPVDRTISEIESLVANGAYLQAVVLCKKLCSGLCTDARPWLIMGAIHGQNNDVVQAERCTRQALAIDPGLGSAHYNLGILLLRQQKPRDAESCLRRAMALRPADAKIYNELGNALRMQHSIKAAMAAYRKAIQLRPGFRDAQFNLGNLFLNINDLHSALGCFRTAYQCDHEFIKAKAMEAIVLEKQDDIDGAFRCLEPWLGREVVEPAIADAFAAVSIHLNREREAIDCLIKAIQADQCENDNRSGLYSRLGALQERLQQYDNAFKSYSKANQLMTIADNAEKFILGLNQSRKIFSKSAMNSAPRAASGGEALIFIVGMPRSGTSLIEQILSVHTQVRAGGELSLMARLAEDVFSELSSGNSRSMDIAGLNQPSVERYADKYWCGRTAYRQDTA